MSVPLTLKPLQPFLTHSKALESIAPDVSYFCKLYCVQEGMKLRSRAPPEDQNVVKKFLFSLMEQLEQQKSKLGSKADDAQAHGVVLNWALKVFKLADDEDRSDNANKITAKNFLAASQFFEVAKQFGELNTDIQDKQKYAKWKAVDILNAIKRGEKPRPGGKDEFLFDGEQDQQHEDNVPINTSSHSSFDIDSHNNNTTVTTNVHSDYSHQQQQQQGNIPTIPNFTSVNFPTIPNIPHSSPSFDIPTIPTPSFNMNDTSTHHIPNSNSSTHNNVPSFPSNVPHNLPTPTPSKPSPQTPHVVSTNTISPTSVSNTNISSTSTSTSSLYQPNEDDVTHATKYAKFVVSALSYDDIGTAVKYLKMALSSLTGEK